MEGVREECFGRPRYLCTERGMLPVLELSLSAGEKLSGKDR